MQRNDWRKRGLVFQGIAQEDVCMIVVLNQMYHMFALCSALKACFLCSA